MKLEINKKENTVTVDGTLYQKVKEIEPEKTYKRERLEKYWYVSRSGYIGEVEDGNDDIDDFNFLTGNYFKTEEEAEYYRDCLLAKQKLKDVAMLLSKGWVPEKEESFQYHLEDGSMWANAVQSGQIKFSGNMSRQDILEHISVEEIKLALSI